MNIEKFLPTKSGILSTFSNGFPCGYCSTVSIKIELRTGEYWSTWINAEGDVFDAYLYSPETDDDGRHYEINPIECHDGTPECNERQALQKAEKVKFVENTFGEEINFFLWKVQNGQAFVKNAR